MQRYQLYHRAVAMSKEYPDQKYDDILKGLMDTKTASDVTKSQTTVKNTDQSAIQPQQGPKKLITVIIINSEIN